MVKKSKNEQIVLVYQKLDTANISKMDISDRILLIKILRQLKKVSLEFDSFREDVINKLKPSDYDEMISKIAEFSSLPQEEQSKAVNDPKYAEALTKNITLNKLITECLGDEMLKITELDFTPISIDAFGKLLESNTDWTLGDASDIEDLICDRKEE